MDSLKFFICGIFFVLTPVGLCTLSFSWWYPFNAALSPISSILMYLCTGLLVLLGILSGCVLLFISTQRVSKHHSITSALKLFIIKYHRLYVGARMLKKFRSACKNPRKTQENLLIEIVRQNKNTDYGRQYKLDEIQCLDDFRKKHPITEYEHYKTFIDRLSKGERNVMTTYKVSRLVLTSGTTGTSKHISHDEDYLDNSLIIQEAFQQEMFSDLHPMQQKLKVHINSEVKRSECGLTIASAVALEEHMTNHYIVYTPPREAFTIGTVREAFYIGLLFALREKQLGSAWISFITIFLDLLKFLEENWPSLVNDLLKGTIRSDLKLDPRIRAALTRKLGSGDPARAMDVKKECNKGFQGIIKRLWPNFQYVSCIDNIDIRSHLKTTSCKGIEIYTPLYMSSESLLGLNLWPFEEGKSEYALNLTENVYEFIKLEESEKENPTTYYVDEVIVGQKYELIISQKYGLYRFRFGDIVKVTGFYKNCPKITFLFRKASILNLIGEKVDQKVVGDSVNAALSRWKNQIKLEHYACAENSLFPDHLESKESGLHYVFFLEIKSTTGQKLPVDFNPETLAKDLQKNLCDRHSFYPVFVKTKQITTPKVYLTKEGAFTKLKEYILANSTTARAQFKMPIKLRKAEMAEVLLENVLPH